MAVELSAKATKPLDFTVNGRQVSTRKIPLGIGLSLFAHAEDGEVTMQAEDMARVIARCLVYTDDKSRVYKDDEIDLILDLDMEGMAALFREISAFSSSTVESAEKN